MVPAGGARDARLSPSAPSPATPRPSREASCGTKMGSGGGRQPRGGRERRRVPARRRASARQTQRLATWDVKAQGGVTKKTCSRRRATTACGRAGPPGADSRRAGGARGAPSRVPRDSPASRRSRRPGPASRRSLHRAPFRGYARRGSFACATPHLSVERQTPSPGVLDPRFAPESAARSTGTFEVDVRSKRAETLPSRAVNAPRHARNRRALTRTVAEREKRHLAGVTSVWKLLFHDCSGIARQV